LATSKRRVPALVATSEHHIRYFGRFPVSRFNDSLGGVDLKCTQRVHFRSTQPKLYFSKIMEFSHHNEYGVSGSRWLK
jgi:hypothetical protein